MTTYQYDVYTKETFNATGKAKGDIIRILKTMGIKSLYVPSKYRILRILQQWRAITRLKKDDEATVIIQYPAVLDTFISRMAGSCRLIAIIHDLQSIRGSKTVTEEIRVLNMFDVVISHNCKMTDYLKENGCSAQIIELGIFDYLNDDSEISHVDFARQSVCFAGNLNKSEFIKNLYRIDDVKFNLYGLLDSPDVLNGVTYSGVLPADKIVNKLSGEYGMVWDGTSTVTCDGVLGNYLKYNNPHKFSLYLAAGKPVIAWKKAAIADFIKDQDVGIVVDNLEELHKKMASITESDYKVMRDNALSIRKRLMSGEYTKKAIQKALSLGENN